MKNLTLIALIAFLAIAALGTNLMVLIGVGPKRKLYEEHKENL